jgi:hypothetical protein
LIAVQVIGLSVTSTPFQCSLPRVGQLIAEQWQHPQKKVLSGFHCNPWQGQQRSTYLHLK